MISFAQEFTKYDKRALKIALLSTIPGLGQLYNRRIDKALAFFLVDIVNVVLIATLMGAKFPFVDLYSQQFVLELSTWRAGSTPFFIIQSLMLSYMLYSQFDAYRDAHNAQSAQKPELTLSHTTCASYVLHVSTIFVIAFLILVKIFPEYHPVDLNQITLTFELENSEETEKAKGDEGKIGEESNVDESAHLRDHIKDEVLASSASAEMSSSDDETADAKPAAEETDTIASKQIITPESKQNPREIFSKGASEEATKSSKQPVEETKISQSSPPQDVQLAQPALSDTANKTGEIETLLEAEKVPEPNTKIAQLPNAAAAGGIVPQITEAGHINNMAASPGTASSASASALHSPTPQVFVRAFSGPYAGLNPPPPLRSVLSSNSIQSRPYASQVPGIEVVTGPMPVEQNEMAMATTDDPYNYNQGENSKGTSPSMLGFMDSSLSGDPDMRQMWSEMSSLISRQLKEQPLRGDGMAITTFTLSRDGQLLNVQTNDSQSEMVKSLMAALHDMPAVHPPVKQLGKMFFQVKASRNNRETFVSLEINSQPSPITAESVSDFKYQVNLQAYLKGIKKQVYSSWKPPVQEGIKPVMIGFKVSTDGSVSDHHIVQSSGDPKLDKAGLNAALSVTKWSQPPAGTSEDLDVCMVLQKCKNCEGDNKSSNSSPVKSVSKYSSGTQEQTSVYGYTRRIIHSTTKL